MINPFHEIDWNPNVAQRRTFAVSLMVGFPVISLVLALVTQVRCGGWSAGYAWLAMAGVAVGLLLRLLPGWARPFYVVWYFLACGAGFVVGNLLLIGGYFLVLLPIGLFVRVTGRSSIRKTLDRACATYWRDEEPDVESSRYYRQY